jgi:hypothetical protein
MSVGQKRSVTTSAPCNGTTPSGYRTRGTIHLNAGAEKQLHNQQGRAPLRRLIALDERPDRPASTPKLTTGQFRRRQASGVRRRAPGWDWAVVGLQTQEPPDLVPRKLTMGQLRVVHPPVRPGPVFGAVFWSGGRGLRRRGWRGVCGPVEGTRGSGRAAGHEITLGKGY